MKMVNDTGINKENGTMQGYSQYHTVAWSDMALKLVTQNGTCSANVNTIYHERHLPNRS